MKGKRLLTLGLFSLFSLTACGGANVKVVTPQDNAGDENQVELAKQEGAVFNKYKELNPSYNESEEQFIDDLSNGKFTLKSLPNEGPQQLTSLFTLSTKEVNRISNTLFDFSDISHIEGTGYNELFKSSGDSELYNFESTEDFYDSGVCVINDNSELIYKTTSGYDVTCGHSSIESISFMVSNDYQVATYYRDIDVAGDTYWGPTIPWEFENTPGLTQMDIHGIMLYDVNDALMSPDSYPVFDAQGHFYDIVYASNVSRLSNTYNGYNYYFYNCSTTLIIFDLNTLENPKLVSTSSLTLHATDYDEYGRPYDDFHINMKNESVTHYTYGGASLNQLFEDKDPTDFLELVPDFYPSSIASAVLMKQFNTSANPMTFTGATSGYTLESDPTYCPMIVEQQNDGSTKISMMSDMQFPGNQIATFPSLYLYGYSYEYDDVHDIWIMDDDAYIYIATPITVEYLEEGIAPENSIFETATISGNDYTAMNGFATRDVYVRLEITKSVDGSGNIDYTGKIQVINPASLNNN